jgi:hypothetical protein
VLAMDVNDQYRFDVSSPMFLISHLYPNIFKTVLKELTASAPDSEKKLLEVLITKVFFFFIQNIFLLFYSSCENKICLAYH